MFPRQAKHYDELKTSMQVIDNIVNAYFPFIQFSATSINLDGKVSTEFHTDTKNLATGLCAICVFGLFDHRKSAQLVMKEPKVILEVKRGDVVFIPSALITHCNLPLGDKEKRYSLVFYTAGGLFRWYDQQKAKTAGTSLETGLKEDQWKKGWDRFSTLQELISFL